MLNDASSVMHPQHRVPLSMCAKLVIYCLVARQCISAFCQGFCRHVGCNFGPVGVDCDPHGIICQPGTWSTHFEVALDLAGASACEFTWLSAVEMAAGI